MPISEYTGREITEEQKKVEDAAKQGKEIEYWYFPEWVKAEKCKLFNWKKYHYRVKPDPEKEKYPELEIFLNLTDVMDNSEVPNFFKRATGRKYGAKEICINDILRICATFWNEHIKLRSEKPKILPWNTDIFNLPGFPPDIDQINAEDNDGFYGSSIIMRIDTDGLYFPLQHDCTDFENSTLYRPGTERILPCPLCGSEDQNDITEADLSKSGYLGKYLQGVHKMNEITIDKDKLISILSNYFAMPEDKEQAYNFFINTIKDCELPNPWKLWSEEKPDETRKIWIKFLDDDFIYDDTFYAGISLIFKDHPELRWRYIDE